MIVAGKVKLNNKRVYTDLGETKQNSMIANCYYFLLCYLFGGDIVNRTILQGVNLFITVPSSIGEPILYFLVLSSTGLFVYKIFLHNFPIREIIPFFLLIINFFVSWMIQPGYNEMYISMLWDFMLGIIGYFCFRYINDWSKLLVWFGNMAFIVTISLAIFLLITGGLERYSMFLGYMNLVGVVISINELIRRHSILHGCNMAFGFLLLLAMGARGPIACCLIFALVRLTFEIRKSRWGIVFFALVSVLTWLVIRKFEEIIGFLIILFNNLNLSTRALYKLQTLQFLNYDTRSDRIQYALDIVREHPVFGVGIGRDRIMLADYYNDPGNAIGNYAHNPLIEMWMQFGIVIGSLACVLIIVIVFKAVFTKANKGSNFTDTRDVILILLANGLLPLLVSGSYFTRPSFFMAIGACVAVNHKIYTRYLIQNTNTERVLQTVKRLNQ